MATAQKLLDIARAEVGTKEQPANSNRVKYNTWYYGREVSGSAYPWCMAFVQWCFKQAGMPLGIKTAGCTTFMNWAKGTGRWVTDNYQPGDVILFNFDGVPDSEHVGICESFSGTILNTIEGNTAIGNDDNGGAVMKRQRSKSLVLGAYRPAYDGQATTETKKTTGGTCTVELRVLSRGSTGENVTALQILLKGRGYDPNGIDGVFGPGCQAAVKKFQAAKGLAQDGCVGPATWKALLK